jgi:hypothetical protein
MKVKKNVLSKKGSERVEKKEKNNRRVDNSR